MILSVMSLSFARAARGALDAGLSDSLSFTADVMADNLQCLSNSHWAWSTGTGLRKPATANKTVGGESTPCVI